MEIMSHIKISHWDSFSLKEGFDNISPFRDAPADAKDCINLTENSVEILSSSFKSELEYVSLDKLGIEGVIFSLEE